MKGNIYIRCLLIIILSHLGFATEDTYIQNEHRIKRNNLVNKNKNKKHERTLHEEFYRDLNPVNYDQDYYPYRPYMEESNDAESGKDSIRNSGKKHITKRRGSKENYFIERDALSKNNHIKPRIKSQKRSKTNLRAKLRRSADIEGQLVNKENVFIGDEEPYLAGVDRMKAIIDYSDNSDSGAETYDLIKNYTNLLTPKELNYQPSYKLNPDYDNLEKSEDKISPYEYLQLFNSSDININELNENNENEEGKRIVVLSPDDFNLRSLSEALGESIISSKNVDLPNCPAKNYKIMNDQELDENIPDEKKEFLNQRDEIKSVYHELLGQNYLKQNLQSAERNPGSGRKAIGDIRAKREQKVKTITLTFPLVEKIESLARGTEKKNQSDNQKIINEKEMKNATIMEATEKGDTGTANVCEPVCTPKSSDTSLNVQLSCNSTTRASRFRELNEGQINTNLSEYIANIVSNSSLLLDNELFNDRIIMADSDAIIPISSNEIIKLKPNNEKKISNENDDCSQDIYIVELSKDHQLNDNALPLQSPKMIFRIPYFPRSKRQNHNIITNKM